MDNQWQMTQDAGLPGYQIVRQNNRWGIWSEEKGLILPCQWWWIAPYEDGLAVVYKDDQYWGLVDESGNWLVPVRWRYSGTYDDEPRDQASNGRFINGYAVIREGDRFGYMDRSFNIISPCIWDLSCSFDKEGHPALVFRRDGNYQRAPGEWGGQHDWYWYYEEIPKCKIHPDDDEKYCRYGYFYLTPKGTVLTPHGEVTLKDGDIDEQLGQGWLHAEHFCGGKARVRDTAIDDCDPDEGWQSIAWDPDTGMRHIE